MEETLRDLLKEWVSAQKESIELNKEILSIWKGIEEGRKEDRKADITNRLASTLVSMKYIRDEYALAEKAFRNDPKNKDIHKILDNLNEIFRNLSFLLDKDNALGYTLPSSKELNEQLEKEKSGLRRKE